MQLCDLNPHIRFASALRYTHRRTVKVTDCRLFYILEGQAALEIHGCSYSLQPGSLFYCCAGSTYSIHDSRDFSLICINFDLDQSRNFQIIPLPTVSRPEEWEQMPVYTTPVANSPFLGDHLFLANATELLSSIQQIVAEFSNDTAYGREAASAILKLQLLLLHRREQESLPPKIRQVQDYMQQHYTRDISNKELAQLVGYHEYYLNRLFTACTGSTLHGYLLKLRLNRAAYLILNTDIALSAIPEQVGFGSYPHFSAYFKQAYGYSPAQYRKHLQG